MIETTPHRHRIFGSEVNYWIYNPTKHRTIVMVHGFRGTHHGLHDIIAQLPDYQIIIPDIPGFGESTPMSERRHDIDGYGDFFAKFIEKLDLKEKPALLGHSFGSIVAARVAAHRPELFTKLILVNAIASPALKGPRTIFSHGAKFYYRIGAALPESVGRAFLSNPLMVRATSELLTKTKNKALKKDIHRHHLEHFSSFQDRKALLEAFNASVGHTALDYAADITAPTLLIAGDADDIAPLKGQYELEAKLPDARLVVLPNIGHLIHREGPKEAAEAIDRFLS
jgi:pimeloyl-ACP methyl ester carboxylesterase